MSSRRAMTVLFACLAVVAAACAPPPPEPAHPALPPGVGVQWLRDAGGAVAAGSMGSPPHYVPSMDRYATLNGSTTGPTPAGAMWLTASPFVTSILPPIADGTAMFPWNGFAGEGIAVTLPTPGIPDYLVTYPGGTCHLYGDLGYKLNGVVPSPDGTKMAVMERDNTAPFSYYTWVTTYSLSGGGCSVLSSAHYSLWSGPPAGGESVSNGVMVWSPGSTAVLYEKFTPGVGASTVRLDANVGATPTTVSPASEGCTAPLGWSIADRILLSCTQQAAGSPGTVVSRLETMPVAGGTHLVIDTMQATLWGESNPLYFHYGYYVPGTTTIVYNDASTMVTNADGHAFPWFQIRLVSDAPGASPCPLLGVTPPLRWHQERLSTSVAEPYAFTDVPNPDFVERFVR